MTWTAYLTVTEVNGAVVRARAVSGDEVQPYLTQGSDQKASALTSNTEG